MKFYCIFSFPAYDCSVIILFLSCLLSSQTFPSPLCLLCYLLSARKFLPLEAFKIWDGPWCLICLWCEMCYVQFGKNCIMLIPEPSVLFHKLNYICFWIVNLTLRKYNIKNRNTVWVEFCTVGKQSFDISALNSLLWGYICHCLWIYVYLLVIQHISQLQVSCLVSWQPIALASRILNFSFISWFLT